jgi:hypothetical protein
MLKGSFNKDAKSKILMSLLFKIFLIVESGIFETLEIIANLTIGKSLISTRILSSKAVVFPDSLNNNVLSLKTASLK